MTADPGAILVGRRRAWPIAVGALLAWMAITLGGEYLQAGSEIPLDDLVSSGLVVALVVAPALLVILVVALRWTDAVGLRRPARGADLRLLVPPALAVVVLLALAVAAGLPAGPALVAVLVNTLLVGISEELMFRGVLFQGASVRFGRWGAVWITVVLFGGVHSLNGFLTGAFGAAILQALLAGGMGIWMAGLRVRLGTILPLIVLHWLWDFAVFSAAGATGSAATIAGVLGLVMAIGLAVWGVTLVRTIPRAATGPG